MWAAEQQQTEPLLRVRCASREMEIYFLLLFAVLSDYSHADWKCKLWVNQQPVCRGLSGDTMPGHEVVSGTEGWSRLFLFHIKGFQLRVVALWSFAPLVPHLAREAAEGAGLLPQWFLS